MLNEAWAANHRTVEGLKTRLRLVGDPVAAGIVAKLAQPGGNLTGISSLTTGLVPKRLEAPKTLISSIRRVRAVIVWPEELAPRKARFPTPPWSQRP